MILLTENKSVLLKYNFKSDIILYQSESTEFLDMIISQDVNSTILDDLWTTINEIPNAQSTGMSMSYDTLNGN